MDTSLPTGYNGATVPLTPAEPARARSRITSLSSSTTLTLVEGASIIRCYAKSQDVYLKWGTTAVTNANFDEVIPAGAVMDFVIPTAFKGASCRVIEDAASASLIVIQK